MAEDLSPSARRVQEALSSLEFAYDVREFSQTTRSAAEAAAAIGCKVEQIAKSIVFRGKATHKPLLIITSGANRVNEKSAGKLREDPVEKADAGAPNSVFRLDPTTQSTITRGRVICVK